MAVEIPFLKKLALPTFSFQGLGGKPARAAGIDIGSWSAKVVQLRYEGERAILETYGEILSAGYLKKGVAGGGLLRYSDEDVARELKDLLNESRVGTKDAIFAIPAGSSFITTLSFFDLSNQEISQAIPFEARKYVPIPLSETIFDWEVIETNDKTTNVLLVAVHKEVFEKLKRTAEVTGLNLRAVEAEAFSLLRSLLGHDLAPTAILNLGHRQTTLVIADRARLRVSHNLERGSHEITRTLAQGIGVSEERAEEIKREVGLSEKMEEREVVSIINSLLENIFSEVERAISLYNRRAERKVQKMILAGGGSNLKGLVDYASTKLGMEVTRANPFNRVVIPAFMQPTFREIGPSFSVAMGLALREITAR